MVDTILPGAFVLSDAKEAASRAADAFTKAWAAKVAGGDSGFVEREMLDAFAAADRLASEVERLRRLNGGLRQLGPHDFRNVIPLTPHDGGAA